MKNSQLASLADQAKLVALKMKMGSKPPTKTNTALKWSGYWEKPMTMVEENILRTRE